MVSAEVREAFDASAVYFPTTIQAVQYYDKYARWNEEKGRRETWIETVARAVDFLRELSHNRLSDTTYQEIQDAILNHDVMPSMRLLATAGKAARRQNLSIFNCSSQPVHSLHSFVEALIISMAGCGVGYSVERKYVDLLPEVKPFTGNLPDDGLHVIADSAEGWTEAFYCGLVRWFDGNDLEYNYDLIRPAGAILRTKGGQASGPRPLARMLAKVRRIIIDAAGRKLTTVEAHHIMCLVGDCAVAGGVRRTAMIALFDPDDDGMLRVKSGDMSGIEHLYNANNSLCWPADEVVGDELLSSHMDEMFGAMRGEPGIWNHYSAQKYMPERRRNLLTFDVANPPPFWPQGIDVNGTMTNPCVTGDTWIAVADGRGSVRISDLVKAGEDVPVYTVVNGSIAIRLMRHFRKTGERVPVLKVTFSNKVSQRVTMNHKFVMKDGTHKMAINLQAGDRVMQMTSMSDSGGDGVIRYLGFEHSISTMNAESGWIKTHKPKTTIRRECEICSKPYIVPADTREIAYCSLWCSKVAEDKALMLCDRHDIDDVRTEQRKTYGRVMSAISRHPSEWEWKAACGACEIPDVCDTRSVGDIKFLGPYVTRVEFDGYEDVYTGTVDESHTFFASGTSNDTSPTRAFVLNVQCGEIAFVRPFGLCNLSIAVARKGDTYADLQRKVQLATIIGTIQSMATHFPGLRPMWKWNAERERLLGVDLSGQMDCDTAQIPEVLAMLKNEVLETNRLYASLLDIPQSAAVTCNKPNGNSSVFLNCSPGIGSRKYRYCIRRITLSSESPMWKVLHAHGWPMEKKRSGANDQWLALFPIAAPDGTRTEADMSALDQCENWLKNKTHWTEHNPSVTVLYRESEVPALRQWISDHRDVICGMTFYPLSDARFEQQPYEEITRAEYNRMVNELPTVDFSLLTHYEHHDTTTAAQELACTSGMCEIM